MTDTDYARIRSIKDFETLVDYLRDELDWPLDAEDVEDLTFEYEPEELGLDEAYQVKVREIKQLRPASPNQHWGIFYLDFEPKRLPVVVLRRILRALVPKKRASMAASQQAVWNLNDLLFISATGEEGSRGISFAHFRENEGGQPRLETFSWDERETHLFYLRNLNLERLRWPDDEDDVEGWRARWASAFTTEHREVIRTSKELSFELAKLARRTRELIREVYGYEARDGSLHRLHESFRIVLIEDLDLDGFADMVAQTISYGLFSARATGEPVLGLAHLEAMVPNTNPFLKELFAEFASMSGHEKHQIDFDELGVSELVELLNTANIEAVLQDFGRQSGGGTQDPVIYFYEDFLKEYDNQQRVRRGEFYTPKPVVSYIVRSVDRVLRDELDCPDGLADISTMEWNGKTWPKVMILDPATGTGTFLETVIEVIHNTMTAKWRAEGMGSDQIRDAWNEYVPKQLLPRLHGFELMMAPYSVAHVKLGLKLKETGYEFESKERLRVYLTNALEEPQDFSGRLYDDFLAHEAEAANRVKRGVPITVVIGNPPYAGISANKGSWITDLVHEYKWVDGEPLGERKHWLNDDYVKFLRLCQLHIDKAGHGVLALITNHAYLDNPTFRGMRQSFMQTFSDTYLLDLHGSVRRNQQVPGDTEDANVFDIQQGVAIGVFVRSADDSSIKVRHADLWGAREDKYRWLYTRDVESTKWSELIPDSPLYLFAPQDIERLHEYDLGWSISDVMMVRSTAIQTSRDKFIIDFDSELLTDRVTELADDRFSDSDLRDRHNLKDGRNFSLSKARLSIKAHGLEAEKVAKLLYRPFDTRFVYYADELINWPRHQVMDHMRAKNLALLVPRQLSSGLFKHVFCTQGLSEMCVASTATKEQNYHCPLYLYPSDNLFDADAQGRKPNLAPEFVEEISATLRLRFVPDGQGDLEETFGPEDVFHYAYAVFHSPTYRERYAEFLKRDFPRLPLTSDRALFSDLSQWGEELVSLHLMRYSSLNEPFTSFPKSGSNVMEKAKYVAEENRVYINKEQYFENVPEETWYFRVGGYQVLDKWLKDRKGRTLTTEDIEHYKRVVAALHETAQIMQEIDEVIEAHGGWPLPGSVPDEVKR